MPRLDSLKTGKYFLNTHRDYCHPYPVHILPPPGVAYRCCVGGGVECASHFQGAALHCAGAFFAR
jgi:hypothetical protein